MNCLLLAFMLFTEMAGFAIAADPPSTFCNPLSVPDYPIAGPFRYRVELETKKNQWTTILDRSQSTEDLLIDYRECTATVGTRARLVITGWPEGMTPGVAEFSVFGIPVIEQ